MNVAALLLLVIRHYFLFVVGILVMLSSSLSSTIIATAFVIQPLPLPIARMVGRTCFGFQAAAGPNGNSHSHDSDDDDHTNNSDNNTKKKDWRDVRAQLVGQDTYNVGGLIETGSLALSLVEESLGCHDLHQPYLHKAVVLILHHHNDDNDDDDDCTTQGVLLNRPTDLILTDADILYDGHTVLEHDDDHHAPPPTTVNEWRVQFGGDVASPFDDERQAMILCLYRAKHVDFNNNHDDNNGSASDVVLKDLRVTSHATACTLIAQGQATVDDFVCFYGFCAWEPGQLQREIQRQSWTMVTTTVDDIWQQLQSQRHDVNQANPRAAGLSMYQHYCQAIGLEQQQQQQLSPNHKHSSTFSDLMLKAWATEYLCLARRDDNDDDYFFQDDVLQRALEKATSTAHIIEPGMVFCAAQPFLLQEQYLHKAIVVVLAESDQASVGLVLNLPTTETYTLTTTTTTKTQDQSSATFNIRYGGASGNADEPQPLLWLHCSRSLRQLGIGKSLHSEMSSSQIYSCTVDQVRQAIDLGLALPREFFVVQGFVVWEKGPEESGGLGGQVLAGNFQRVPNSQVDNVWSLLQSQQVLTHDTLQWNLQTTLSAWTLAGLVVDDDDDETKNPSNRRNPAQDECGDDMLVFGSDVSISDLADVALGVWMSIFLLGDAEYAPTR